MTVVINFRVNESLNDKIVKAAKNLYNSNKSMLIIAALEYYFDKNDNEEFTELRNQVGQLSTSNQKLNDELRILKSSLSEILMRLDN